MCSFHLKEVCSCSRTKTGTIAICNSPLPPQVLIPHLAEPVEVHGINRHGLCQYPPCSWYVLTLRDIFNYIRINCIL